jgi:hypothetical protein
MTYPIPAPGIVTGFAELVERVRRGIEQLREAIQRVIDNAWRAVRLLPGAIADRIRELCRQVAEEARRALGRLEQFVAECIGSPAAVWETGATWVQRFAKPLSTDVAEMNSDHLAGDYYWDGKAADAYVTATDRQKNALTALQTIGADIHSALGDVAVGICAMWATAAAGLLTATAAILGAVVAAATVVGAPVSLALVLTALAALLLGLSTAIVGFLLVVERANDGMTTLQNRMNDNSGFGDGDWPMSPTERFSDGAAWEPAE